MRKHSITLIQVGPDLKWDLSESERVNREDVLRHVAERAIGLAEQAGADPEELEMLSMLLETAR